MIISDNYRGYVIKNGKFIGAFEEMYQNVDDPWNHGDATDIQYDLILFALAHHKIQPSTILDLGCGKGAFTSRIKNTFTTAEITGIDISGTAIRKARARNLNIQFKELDIRKEYPNLEPGWDLIIMSQLVWYILPELNEILNHLTKTVLNDGGYLLISQAFYQSGQQSYGLDCITQPKDVILRVNLPLIEMIEMNRTTNYNCIMLFHPPSKTYGREQQP